MKNTVVDQVLGGNPQAVAISQTNKVVSNVFQIGAEDAVALLWLVDATVASGTGAVVKLQHSVDNVSANFVDVDATNAKVTLAATGRYPLAMSPQNTNFASKMPLGSFLRFVCTTTSGDAVTINHIQVQLHG